MQIGRARLSQRAAAVDGYQTGALGTDAPYQRWAASNTNAGGVMPFPSGPG